MGVKKEFAFIGGGYLVVVGEKEFTQNREADVFYATAGFDHFAQAIHVC